MACASINIFTAATDSNLCSGGGDFVRLYGDNTILPLPGGIELYPDSSCTPGTEIIDTFYFEYQGYIYYYYNGGTDSDPVPCPTPTPTPTMTVTPTPTITPTITSTNTPTPTITSTNTPTPTPTPTPSPTACPQDCSGCGPSYSAYSEDQCYSLDIIGATPPLTTFSLVKSNGSIAYSWRGSFVYDPGYSVSGYTNFGGGDFVNLPSIPLWENTSVADSIKGPLNRCGVWTCNTGACPPFSVWIGFSQCLDIEETKTYYIGIGGDNEFKLVLDGITIVNTRLSNAYWYGLGQNRPFQRWNIYPITINSGSHILELYGWNDGSIGTMGCEIYDNTLSELNSATVYSDLDVLFTSSGQSEVTIVQDGSGNYLSSGYTCSSGYVYNACNDTCVKYEFCDICVPVKYCIINTDSYNGTYGPSGTYGLYDSYSGLTGYIFYSTTEDRWCLAGYLGDPCVQFGAYNSMSPTPDLDDTVMYPGICVTTTTTTNPCSTLDIDAIFDCYIPPTPTNTPTPSITPTLTPTPSPTDPCGGRFLEASGFTISSTPTPTPTLTPSPTPVIIRPCVFSGEVIFNSINEIIQCSNSKKFKDCFTGIDYFTSDVVYLYGTTEIPKEGYVYNAIINNQGCCVTFEGLVDNISGVDIIELTNEVGPANTGSCLQCNAQVTPTPTLTPTMTPTPTPTASPCVSYQYRVTNLSPSRLTVQYMDCGKGFESLSLNGNTSAIICSITTPTSNNPQNLQVTPLGFSC
jgi:hypothetical protein